MALKIKPRRCITLGACLTRTYMQRGCCLHIYARSSWGKNDSLNLFGLHSKCTEGFNSKDGKIMHNRNASWNFCFLTPIATRIDEY